jgi:hypothetical protein
VTKEKEKTLPKKHEDKFVWKPKDLVIIKKKENPPRRANKKRTNK